jgi:ribose/xylose/arabinose/galactoside ABC-type transport system permease subunit
VAVAATYAVLLVILAIAAPGFFAPGNLRDLLLDNAAVMLAAVGMTFVILARQIDISIGSQFAIVGVAAGNLAKAGVPMALVVPLVLVLGAAMGGLNGLLVALELPSIVVTLASMTALREALRWRTQGEDVLGLPDDFQWLGLGQDAGRWVIVGVALVVFLAAWWGARNLSAGRAVYATGSDAEAARLLGLRPKRVVFSVFVLLGTLTALAGVLAAVRFPQVQTNAGLGLELKVIAAVVVGGTAVSGGRGSLLGTLLGVALLGTLGPALTFLKVSAFWEQALQGAIILGAVTLDGLRRGAATPIVRSRRPRAAAAQ